MTFVSKTISVGGSLMITIPKQIVEMLNIRPNEQLELEVKKPLKSAFGIYKGIGSFKKEDELNMNA
jgi:bifunctional DNA-binding transcriptional regulator/antitoxin component of YhaV-PrlF toxin-antitoxin module